MANPSSVLVSRHRLRLRAPNQYVKLWFESILSPVLDELRKDDGRSFEINFRSCSADVINSPPNALSCGCHATCGDAIADANGGVAGKRSCCASADPASAN
jgi:hypothetical protein